MKRNTFVKTSNLHRFLAGLDVLERRAAPEACFLVVTSEPGFGKTKTLHWYSTQNADAIYLRAKSGWTRHWFLAELLKELNPHGTPITKTEDMFKEVLKRMIGRNYVLIIDEGMMMEFVSATSVGASSDVYEKLLRFLDERVTLAVLGQVLTSGQTRGGGGSLALGQVHNEVRKDLMRADARQLGATINRDLVRPLVDLNLGPREHYPRVIYRVPEPEDLKGLTASLKDLVPLGLRVGASVVRDKLGLPDPDPKEEILQAPAAAVGAPAPPPPAGTSAHARGGCPHCGSASHARDGGRDALDGLVEDGLEDWTVQLSPMTQPLVEAIQKAQSLEDLQELLREAAGKMDPEALAEALARATFLARAAGEGGLAPSRPGKE